MSITYYSGTIRRPDGTTRVARLRETLNFWSEGHVRWRKSDGTPAAGFVRQRLILSSLKELPPIRGANKDTTHIGQVRKSQRAGNFSWIGLRETKHAWVDAEGKRYRKSDNGYEKGGAQLLLDSPTPYKQPRDSRA